MTSEESERLLRLLVLRQVEAHSSTLRIAYWRLEKALAKGANRSAEELILDWLKAELMILSHQGAEADEIGAALFNQAIEVCGALRI